MQCREIHKCLDSAGHPMTSGAGICAWAILQLVHWHGSMLCHPALREHEVRLVWPGIFGAMLGRRLQNQHVPSVPVAAWFKQCVCPVCTHSSTPSILPVQVGIYKTGMCGEYHGIFNIILSSLSCCLVASSTPSQWQASRCTHFSIPFQVHFSLQTGMWRPGVCQWVLWPMCS